MVISSKENKCHFTIKLLLIYVTKFMERATTLKDVRFHRIQKFTCIIKPVYYLLSY
jgi:hypothetical protein